jgi:hypothetical protein
MDHPSPVFKKNYEGYLRALDKVDFSLAQSILGIVVDEDCRTARIPFFQTNYQVSRQDVVDNTGKRPDYGTCVVLLKYLLMCPPQIPFEKDWVNNRDFKDSGQAQNVGLFDYATGAIAKRYSGNISRLKSAAGALGGRPPDAEYPYDLSAVFTVLPRIPVLFLYNDADAQFPAQASILFERRAEHFLDAECRVMVGWYLFEYLKRAE